MPALSPTMETGTIASWAIGVGDSFSAGDAICSIETDKASMDFEAQDDGILAKILVQGPTAVDLPVGTAICVVVDDVKDIPAFDDFLVAAAPAAVAAAPAAAPQPAAPPQGRTVAQEDVLLPSARHLSHSKGIDATGLAGTAKGGRISKGDVLAALASGTPMPPLAKAAATVSATPAAAAAPIPLAAKSTVAMADLVPPEASTHGGYEDTKNNKMRMIIASRLTQSKREVPHFYTSVEVELDQILALRKVLAKKHDIKVSVNDLVIRCSAMALRDVPEVNSTFNAKTNTVERQHTIDISVAVATPTGLITPIVPHTDTLGLADIANVVKDLAGRARDGKLQPHEYQGGTFCISNLGMFGIDEFSAVINPPQAAILAVGGGTARIVPTPYVDGAAEQVKPSIKTIMTARLSADRRVVDEATAALFLSSFKHYMTKPELLML
jgi:pyruvate dehydrogenase E2 component (dihydrolipoamide acetyltransferase)